MKISCKIIGVNFNGHNYIVVIEDNTVNKVRIPIIVSDIQGTQIFNIVHGDTEIDLLSNLSSVFNIEIEEVYILDNNTGIFEVEIKFTNGEVIQTSVSDALLLLYTLGITELNVNSKVLKEHGIKLNSFNEVDDTEYEYTEEDAIESINDVEKLETDLENAIENDDFILAAKIRDQIKSLKE